MYKRQIVSLHLFLGTELGQALRGTGDNETMMRSLGVNTDRLKILGLAISNALVGLSGALVAQYQGFADISMGIGMIVIGLASVIVGEVIPVSYTHLDVYKRQINNAPSE